MPKAAAKPRPKGWIVPELDEPGEGDIVLTHSEIEAYRQCPLKWMLGYKEHWKIVDEDRPDDHPLTKGTLYHEVMETHYLALQQHGQGARGLAVARERVREILWDGPNQTELQGLVWWMYEGYVEKYGADPQWEILAVEVKFQIRLRDPQGRPTRYILKGKLDMVVRDRKTQKIWIVDHKSGQNLPDQMELDVADQFGVYSWLMRESGIVIIGTIHSANRTTRNQGDLDENWALQEDGSWKALKSNIKRQTPEQRFRRTLMNRSDKELDAIARDFWAVCVNAYPSYAGMEQLPIYSSPDPRQCSWKCDFLEAHLMARKGRNIRTALAELGFVQHHEERY